MRFYAVICFTVLSACDLLQSILRQKYPWFTTFSKTVVVYLLLPQIRKNLKSVAQDLRDSMTLLFSIFAFIFFFSTLGYYLFKGTF